MAHVFHWKHGWIPLDGSAHRAADHAHAESVTGSKADRLAASRAKNADRDAAKEQRLAEHRAAATGKDADRRIRYLAAQNAKSKS